MDRYAVLQLWIFHHGALSERHRELFLARPEVEEILRFPHDVVIVCMRKSKRLKEIVECLRSRPRPAVRAPLSPYKPQQRGRSKMASVAEGASGSSRPPSNRSGRSRSAGQVWTAPVKPYEARRATPDFDQETREPYL